MLANLRALFGVIVDIIFLRRGPEDLPASQTLLAVAVILNLAVIAITASLLGNASPGWQAQLALETAVALAWYYTAFNLAKKRERFLQTTTAVFLTITLFAPLFIPLMNSLSPYLEKKEAAPLPLVVLALALSAWVIAVQVRIVKSAFEWPVAGVIAFLFAQQVFTVVVLALIFGVSSKAA